MLSVAFETDVEEGVIKIPAEYRQEYHHRVTVILLRDEAAVPEDDIIGELLAHPVEVADFRPLSRAETSAC